MNLQKPHKTLALFSIFIVFFSLSFGLFAPRAEAQLGSIGSGLAGCAGALGMGGIGGAITSIAGASLGITVPVSDATVAGNTGALTAKESCLDGIVFALSQIVLRSMTQSVVSWINSGFQGDPLFISNPEQYFGSIVEERRQRAIWEAQRIGGIYARDVAVSLVKSAKKEPSVSDAIAENCIEGIGATQTAFNKSFNNSYAAGDYSTRLARAEKSKAEKPQGFFASVAALGKRALAQVSGSNETAENPFSGSDELEDGDYQNAYVSCPSTPTEKAAAAERFLNGEEFSWRAFKALGDGDNAISRVTTARNNLATQQQVALAEAQRQATQNRGYLPQTECDLDTVVLDPDTKEVVSCTMITITPGAVVAGAADQITESSFRSAELNREIGQAFDQIMNALFNQMINQGLSAVTQNGGVFGQIGAGAIIAGSNELRTQADIKRALTRQVDDALLIAKQYVVIKKDVIASTLATIEGLGDISTVSGYNGSFCPGVFAQAEGDVNKTGEYQNIASNYQTEVDILATDILALEELKAKSAATSDAGISDMSALYSRIAARMPNSANVASAQGELGTIRSKEAQVTKWNSDCAKEAEAQAASTQTQTY